MLETLEADGPYRLSVRSLRRFADPFRDDLWNHGAPLRQAEVRRAIRDQRFEARPNTWALRAKLEGPALRRYDIERVAHLTAYRDPAAISIDVMAEGDIRMEDGCHRLAAAIMRGDHLILTSYGGWVEVFQRTFRKRLPPLVRPLAGPVPA